MMACPSRYILRSVQAKPVKIWIQRCPLLNPIFQANHEAEDLGSWVDIIKQNTFFMAVLQT